VCKQELGIDAWRLATCGSEARLSAGENGANVVA
jgi:hypothetical protein